MRHKLIILAMIALMVMAVDVMARSVPSRGGGGSGGSRSSGSSASRSHSSSPSMTRSSSSAARPSSSSARPPSSATRPSSSYSSSRPAAPQSRPSYAQPSAPRPSSPSSVQRPTTTRPSAPATPAQRPGVGTMPSGSQRPNQGQLSDFMGMPSQQPSQRPATRPAAQPSTLPGRTEGIGARPSQLPAQPGRTEGIGARPSQLPAQTVRPGQGVRPGSPNRTPRPDWSNRPGWDDRPIRPRPPDDLRPPRPVNPPDYHNWHHADIDIDVDDGHYSHYGDDYYWWGWPTAAAVTSFVVLDAAQPDPVYYSYGTGGNVYYENNYYHVNGQQVPATEYYNTVYDIAAEGSEVTEEQASQIEWLPLGYFAVSAKDSPDTGRFIQLAVSKEGVIGGTYFNEATGASRALEGSVDKTTQQAAWTFADGANTDTVMEAGIFNFTKDEVPVMVHFGESRVQEASLVRVEPPAEEAVTEAAAPDAASNAAPQP